MVNAILRTFCSLLLINPIVFLTRVQYTFVHLRPVLPSSYWIRTFLFEINWYFFFCTKNTVFWKTVFVYRLVKHECPSRYLLCVLLRIAPNVSPMFIQYSYKTQKCVHPHSNRFYWHLVFDTLLHRLVHSLRL